MDVKAGLDSSELLDSNRLVDEPSEPTESRTVDPYEQEHVARTNGRLYRPLVNALPRYPIPNWPYPSTSKRNEVSLDIGCGWGRWLVSAANAGYLSVGIDIQVERLQAARRVLAQHRIRGYVVAADLRSLPFRSA
jgi:tRNA G46 methylase TrmB